MKPPLRAEDSSIVDRLVARAPSETLPLFLELARRRAEKQRPAGLLTQLARDAFVAPSPLDLRLAHQLDGIALDAAEGFEAVLLSPVAPLGTCSVVSPTNQDRAVSTTRSSEVVSDPTNVLALVCARRLAAQPDAHVRLCTVHQVLRAQRSDAPSHSQHFRLFCAAEAGRAQPAHGFEVDAVLAHAAMFLRLFDAAESRLGCSFPDRAATLHVGPNAGALGDRLRDKLRAELPSLRLTEAALESGYYDGVRLLLRATSREGAPVPLGDIGVFDWLTKLTANRHMRFVASGIGIQLFPLLFRDAPPR